MRVNSWLNALIVHVDFRRSIDHIMIYAFSPAGPESLIFENLPVVMVVTIQSKAKRRTLNIRESSLYGFWG
jgi:hypothetical protein